MPKSKRNSETTRQLLLHSAAQEIHHSGFRSTDLQTILDRVGVTKGALYHYFDSKETLGYAVVDEVISEITRQKWLEPLQKAENPLDTLTEIFLGSSLLPEHIRRGCPTNNLAQEMSPIDEGFRTRLAQQFAIWHRAMADALRRGQAHGQVRSDLHADETATFLIATYEGYISLAKNAQDPEVLASGMRTMARNLETLRPAKKV
jgi:TetR/AcrR family transcriptional regulator, transcriptional repressor for nem operon